MGLFVLLREHDSNVCLQVMSLTSYHYSIPLYQNTIAINVKESKKLIKKSMQEKTRHTKRVFVSFKYNERHEILFRSSVSSDALRVQ